MFKIRTRRLIDIAIYASLIAIVFLYINSLVDSKYHIYLLVLYIIIIFFSLQKKWSLPSISGILLMTLLKKGDSIKICWFDNPLDDKPNKEGKLTEKTFDAKVVCVHFRPLKNPPPTSSGKFWQFTYRFAPGCLSVEFEGKLFEVPFDLVEK